jgi:hypothetical protein
MMKNKNEAARHWLTQYGHLLNLRALSRECGIGKDALSRHCLGAVNLSEQNAEIVAETLQKMNVKLK